MEQSAQNALLLYSSALQDSQKNFGNPSSIHWAGRKARGAVETARESIAQILGVEDADSLLFTGSATESINTALKGFFFYHHAEKRRVRFISSTVEHDATLDTLRFLESLGAIVDLLPVNREGELSLDAWEQSLNRSAPNEAVLVSLLAANNETGVIFPWEKIAALAKAKGATFHLDAVQAPGKIPGFSLSAAPVDLASFSAHKIGGAKGVGLLVQKKGVKLQSLLHGGAQERKRRAGTLNVAGIVSFGAAALALQNRDLAATEKLRNYFEAEVIRRVAGAHVQGQATRRTVNTSHLLFDSVRGEGLLMSLDLEGFAVSSGSACQSGTILPSHVMLAMGFDSIASQSAIRVSLGPETTQEEMELFLNALEKVVARIRTQSAHLHQNPGQIL